MRPFVLLALALALAGCLENARDLLGGADADAAADVATGDGEDAATDPTVDAPADPDVGTPDVAADPDLSDPDLSDPAIDADVSSDAADAQPEADAPSDEITGSGTWADPYVVRSLPVVHEADTADSDERLADSYACSPDTNESGAEVVYRLEIDEDGIISAEVDDVSGDGVDVDVHILDEADADSCTVRNNVVAHQVVAAGGEPYVVVDTWVNASNVEFPGAYELTLEFQPLPGGDCLMEENAIDMINRDDPLALPVIGEVVREAHLVTTSEFSPGVWPTSFTDGIENHYAITEAASGYEMDRSEPWAPAGEGGSEYGQGSGTRPPPLEETWYVNMYWADRPDPGTRMLVFNPANGRGVVTAAGYETGPGSNLRIGGATEEIHDHLDSTHRSLLLMGFLVDQELDFGPVTCD